MRDRDRLIEISRLVVRGATVINRLFLLAVIVSLLLSWVFAAEFASFLSQSTPGVDAASEIIGLRGEMLIGIVMAIATDRLLVALGQVITSASIGDPFNAGNARKLQTVGWSLLVLQLLDVPAMLLGRFFPSLGSGAPDAGVSVGGWVAVLMVFILARVFAAGSVMRADLEGTI